MIYQLCLFFFFHIYLDPFSSLDDVWAASRIFPFLFALLKMASPQLICIWTWLDSQSQKRLFKVNLLFWMTTTQKSTGPKECIRTARPSNLCVFFCYSMGHGPDRDPFPTPSKEAGFGILDSSVFFRSLAFASFTGFTNSTYGWVLELLNKEWHQAIAVLIQFLGF